MPKRFGHSLLRDQEDRIALVIVVGQDDHRHILIRLVGRAHRIVGAQPTEVQRELQNLLRSLEEMP